MWQNIADSSLAVLLGAVGGGVIGAIIMLITWWHDARERIVRQLLSEGLAIHASKEAWILEGENYKESKLSEHKNLPTDSKSSGLWLRKVEVRAALDQAKWNAPENQFYGFLDATRTWIVRDKIDEGEALSYPKVLSGPYLEPHAALLSSRAMHELCGWIERVASVQSTWCLLSQFLSAHALEMLRPLLISVAGEDRLQVFGDRLTKRAKDFLSWYRDRDYRGNRNVA